MTDTIITNQGTELEVTLQTGHKDKVQIKLLPITAMPKYLEALDDDTAMIQLATGKSKTYAEGLSFDSALELLDKIEEVNGPNAERWADRKMKRVEKYLPVAQRTMSKMPGIRPSTT